MDRYDQAPPLTSEPVAPEAPTNPYWPISTDLDVDFDRWHPDYIESP